MHKNRRLKVLHILNTGSYSGAENVVITIIKHTRNDIDSVYLSLDGDIRSYLKAEDIKFYPVKKLSVKTIRQAIKDIKPDIIHAHDFTAGIIASASTFRIPIINHLHNNSPWIKHLSYRTIIYGISCLRYKTILTVSSSVMDEFIFGKIFKRKSQVIGNPIDVSEIRRKGEAIESDSDYKSDVLFLGRLTEQKNPLGFVRIIAKVKEALPDIQASIVGDGELKCRVENLVSELHLSDNVTLFGFQNNPYPFIVGTRLLCIPSLWERFGLAAVEALACGKPVYASPVGGLPSIVNNECGMLCESETDFINEIVRCLTNDESYHIKCDGAFERSKELANISDYKECICNVYNSLGGKAQATDDNWNDITSDVIYLGRLSEAKNPIFFLEIIAKLKERIPHISVAIVGDGELRGLVERKIVELSLKDNINIYGFRENPYKYLKNSKVLCMPSLWEGFGMAAVEAMAFGKPVVATPVGGLVEIVDDSCGMLCTEVCEFSDEISKLLNDYTYYVRKSSGAYENASRVSNIEHYITKLEEIYKAVTT